MNPKLPVHTIQHMPTELWLKVFRHLELRDISVVSRLTRNLHRFLTGHDEEIRVVVLAELIVFGANLDCTTVIELVATKYRNQIDLGSPILLEDLEGMTFPDFALAADAPKVAGCLVKAGCDYSAHNSGNFPDQTPLFLALAGVSEGSSANSQRELNEALRIACRYGSPRTARFLLTAGADANTSGPFEGNAIYLALGRRDIPAQFKYCLPYLGKNIKWVAGRLIPAPTLMGEGDKDDNLLARYCAALSPLTANSGFKFCSDFVHGNIDQHTKLSLASLPMPSTSARAWHEQLARTVAALIDFGADAAAPTFTTRRHECSPRCWRSTDPQVPNADGYTSLFVAITQGQLDAAMALLGYNPDPIVRNTAAAGKTMSALYAAVKFAFFPLVHALLDGGVDLNTQDAQGRTGLYHLLENENCERVWHVLATLEVLREAGADFEIRSYGELSDITDGLRKLDIGNDWLMEGKNSKGKGKKGEKELGPRGVTPNEMGKKHVLPGVKEMFHPPEPLAVELRKPLGPPIKDVMEELARKGKEYREGGNWGDELNGYDVNADLGLFPGLKEEWRVSGLSSRAPGMNNVGWADENEWGAVVSGCCGGTGESFEGQAPSR
ncbi:hypothetical protein N0V88_007600 [Collariella sp. IMI 366227]|nr:hypothetical protein N0V88_007600 [Collariella sp. IMI 366227]